VTPALRRGALTAGVLVACLVAGAGAGSTFFFAADREVTFKVDEELKRRLRGLADQDTGQSGGAARGSSRLPAPLLWPVRLLALLFALGVLAAVAYALVRFLQGLLKLRRLRQLRHIADVDAEDYADEHRSDDDAATELRRRLRTHLEVGVGELEGQVASREVVIACYQALEQEALRVGAGSTPADTPTELVLRLLATYDVPAPSAEELVELYEQARFSPRPVDDEMREAARRCLGDVRAGLATS
jgi:hypothetical protein